jgi:ribonuclease P/MRP protein subunit POP8
VPNVEQVDAIVIDKLSWKSIILTSLGKLYGLVGEASHFDVIQAENMTSIIRLHSQDQVRFGNSLMAHTFLLNKYCQLGADVNCRVRINKCDRFLGAVIDDELIEGH